jgi:alginate O-acetyltransferase complex protein AlgI
MVFANLTFLYIFLPLNLLLYYAWPNQTYRNVLLTLFSFAFYAWGEPIWVCLLMFSAAIDYVHGKLIGKWRGTHKAKWPLISSIVLNIGLLVAFKYSGFLAENINALLGTNFYEPNFALPIGISFYTFQTISYVIDVYRNEVPVQRSFLKFTMYVSLYPQLVAGPIVRYAHIAKEINDRMVHLTDISAGMMRFCIGLFKKVAIANVAGELNEQFMAGDLNDLSTPEAWYGIMLFSLQIYFDFSGYSDMAIGLGRMFGFHFHENFIYPYISRSATDFWRRWHISLGSFFRDYVYIPLGGKKKAQYRNLLIVWFLTGFWHGASWNFILWGLFWGLLIFLERLFLRKIFDAIPGIFGHLYLIFAAMLGWVLFYFEDMTKLTKYFSLLFGGSDVSLEQRPQFEIVFLENVYWMGLALLLCLPLFPLARNLAHRFPAHYRPAFTIALGVFSLSLLLISTTLLVGKSYNPFLYFRF